MHFQHDGLRNPSKSSLEIPKTVVPSSTALLETSKIDQRHRTGTVFPGRERMQASGTVKLVGLVTCLMLIIAIPTKRSIPVGLGDRVYVDN